MARRRRAHDPVVGWLALWDEYYGPPLGETVQGHNSTFSTDPLYRWNHGWTKDDEGNWQMAESSRGHFDEQSQSYKELVVRLARDTQEEGG